MSLLKKKNADFCTKSGRIRPNRAIMLFRVGNVFATFIGLLNPLARHLNIELLCEHACTTKKVHGVFEQYTGHIKASTFPFDFSVRSSSLFTQQGDVVISLN